MITWDPPGENQGSLELMFKEICSDFYHVAPSQIFMDEDRDDFEGNLLSPSLLKAILSASCTNK